MRDLRKYARQTNARLFVGFLALLLIIGLGLIYIFYGPQGALFGFICLLAGLAPLVLIWLALSLIEWITKKINPE